MNDWKRYIIEESSKENKLTKKQQDILIAAVELISEKGYEKVSTAEIAEQAGVAEGTIFRQYKTKKDLLNTIVMPTFLKLIAPRIFESFVKEVIYGEHSSIENFINNLVDERFEFIKKNLPLIKIVIKEMIAQDYVREEFKALFMEYGYDAMNKTMDAFKEKDEIVDLPNMTIFRIIVTTVMGYFVPRFILYPNLNWDDEKEKEITKQCIIKSIKK